MKLKNIIENFESVYFKDFNRSILVEDIELSKEIQGILHQIGVYSSVVDGLFGAITCEALQDFIETEGLSQDYILDDIVAELLLARVTGIDENLVEDFGNSEEDFVTATIKLCERHGLPLKEQIAYVIATAEHETGRTYKPVVEAHWLSESWRERNLRYYPYHGRGYVQITWKYNYEKFSKLLNKDFVSNPDAVLDPKTSLFILVYGMSVGGFSGKRLGAYVNKNEKDFYRARKVVNGKDKAEHIANLAEKWLQKLLDREEQGIQAKSIGLSDEMARRYKRLR
ncbi:MAG: Unknown protein [uncultured Sulfurovum sp.]|uniref:Carboxypeptidase n=1 Tax=uncultured Sulfurovum sp. TaxID=269237 RepID=A0A6S6SK20_9BACT|nr:MAG: Unknown protein [uncultured Sulfurovum sp.]